MKHINLSHASVVFATIAMNENAQYNIERAIKEQFCFEEDDMLITFTMKEINHVKYGRSTNILVEGQSGDQNFIAVSQAFLYE